MTDLKIFKAFGLEEGLLTGGSTRPVLMRVGDESGNGPFYTYVVKFLEPKFVCKEIFAQELALQFDLQTPDVAVIYVDKKLMDNIKEYLGRTERPGYYFGSRFIENTVLYSKNQKIDAEDMVRIFGFDFIIRNVDRRVTKPNLLMRNQEPILIDHELSLEIGKTFDDYIASGDISFLQKENDDQHIFIEPLKTLNAKNEGHGFGVLAEYCRTLNVENLLNLAHELIEIGFEEADIANPIVTYLDNVRRKHHEIPQLCTRLIP